MTHNNLSSIILSINALRCNKDDDQYCEFHFYTPPLNSKKLDIYVNVKHSACQWKHLHTWATTNNILCSPNSPHFDVSVVLYYILHNICFKCTFFKTHLFFFEKKRNLIFVQHLHTHEVIKFMSQILVNVRLHF